MSELVQLHTRLAPTTEEAATKINKLANAIMAMPQINFITDHLLHGGMYTRTVFMPSNTVGAAVLIQVPTVLIVVGNMNVYSNADLIYVEGYNVLPGSGGRKIAFFTYSKVAMSMIFPTSAKTVEEAQEQFTPEFAALPPLSDVDRHRILITGE